MELCSGTKCSKLKTKNLGFVQPNGERLDLSRVAMPDNTHHRVVNLLNTDFLNAVIGSSPSVRQ